MQHAAAAAREVPAKGVGMSDTSTTSSSQRITVQVDYEDHGITAMLFARPDAKYQFNELMEHLRDVIDETTLDCDEEIQQLEEEEDEPRTSVTASSSMELEELDFTVTLTMDDVAASNKILAAKALMVVTASINNHLLNHLADPFGDKMREEAWLRHELCTELVPIVGQEEAARLFASQVPTKTIHWMITSLTLGVEVISEETSQHGFFARLFGQN